jgi:predicted dehydrogenase
MNPFDAAAGTVSSALMTGQIGTPVAARVVAQLNADHGLLERGAARTIETVSEWLDGQPERLTAMGGAETGHVATLTAFDSGQSALVSVGTCGVGPPLLEIVVWGNRGILAWEADCGSLDREADNRHSGLSEQAGRLLELVRKSLKLGDTAWTDGRSTEARPSNPRKARDDRTKEASAKLKPLKPPYGLLLVAGDHTHQPNYTEALAADPRVKLIGLTDEAEVTARRRRLNRQMARRLSIPFLPDLDSALRREDVHIVSICAEPVRRGRIVVKAAEAGKHLYLDKPLAASLRDADAITAAANKSGVVSNMWSLVRSDAAMRMRDAVSSGRLGDLTAFHADLCFAKGTTGTAKLGRRRQECPTPDRYELLDSKRELSNVGVYPLVSLLWLTGKHVCRVCAATGNYFFQEHQANDMEDFGQMLLELDGGLVASISAGRAGWRSHPSYGLNRTCVIGSKSAARFDAHLPRVTVWADVEPWSAPRRDPADPMGMWAGPKEETYVAAPKQSWITPPSEASARDAKYFLDCIEAGRSSDVPADLAACATEALLAAYRSTVTGNVIALPLPRE